MFSFVVHIYVHYDLVATWPAGGSRGRGVAAWVLMKLLPSNRQLCVPLLECPAVFGNCRRGKEGKQEQDVHPRSWHTPHSRQIWEFLSRNSAWREQGVRAFLSALLKTSEECHLPAAIDHSRRCWERYLRHLWNAESRAGCSQREALQPSADLRSAPAGQQRNHLMVPLGQRLFSLGPQGPLICAQC